MLLLDISAKKIKISADGGQTGVPENLLKAEDISTVNQIALGESVAMT